MGSNMVRSRCSRPRKRWPTTLAADQFMCYLTEYLVRNAGGLTVNVPGNGTSVNDGIGPSVCYGYTSEVDNQVDMLLPIIEHGDGFTVDPRNCAIRSSGCGGVGSQV